jgi:hypothetical protein
MMMVELLRGSDPRGPTNFQLEAARLITIYGRSASGLRGRVFPRREKTYSPKRGTSDQGEFVGEISATATNLVDGESVVRCVKRGRHGEARKPNPISQDVICSTESCHPRH